MKKTRILSTILAVVMTATCLPAISASAAGADANLLSGAEITSNIPTGTNGGAQIGMRERDSDASHGGYLHLGTRTAAKYGLGYNFETTFEAGETYYLSFDMRAAVSYQDNATNTWPGGRIEVRVGGNVAHSARPDNTAFKYWELSRLQSYSLGINDFSEDYSVVAVTEPVRNKVMVVDDYTKNGEYKGTNNSTTTDYVAVYAVDLRGNWANIEWRNYEIMLPNVTSKVTDAYIAFFGDGKNAGPVEIDNIRLYTRVDDARAGAIDGAILEEFTFTEAPDIITSGDIKTKGAFFVTDGIERPETVSDGAKVEWVSSTKQYKEIAFNAANAGNATLVPATPAVTYTVSDVAITPGVYELTGEFRDGWHTGETLNTNMTVTPTLALGSGDMALSATTVTTEWTPVSYRFVIDENTTLSKVTFASNVKETLQFRDVSLVKLGNYVVENAEIESGLLVGATNNYTDEVDSKYDFNDFGADGYVMKNGYISVSRLHWYWRDADKGWGGNMYYINMTLNETVKESTTYAVSFKAREHVPNDEYTTVRAMFEGQKLFDDTAIDGEWKEFTGSYTIPANATGPLDFAVRRGTVCQDAPVDFDDITIWIDADADKVLDAGETVLYSENYNDPDKTYIGTANGLLKVTLEGANGRLGETKLSHAFEDNYVRSTGGINYTGLELDEGIYTFKADLRVPFFHHEEMRNGKNEDLGYAGDYGNKAWRTADDPAAAEAYAYNVHDAKFTFTMTNGTDTKDEYSTVEDAITPNWGIVETAFTVEEGYTLTAIKVTPEFKAGANIPAANKALDIKSADVKFVSPLSQTVVTDDAENFLNDATEQYNGGLYEVIEGDGNGFITVDRRPWQWNAAENNWVSNSNLFTLNTNEAVSADYTYFIKYDVRHSVASNSKQYVRVQFMDQNVSGDTVTASDTWETHQYSLDGTGLTGKVRATFRRNYGVSDIPVDFDNLVIWKELTGEGNGEFGEEDAENVIYSADYNDAEAAYIGGGAGKLEKSLANLYHNFETDYSSLKGIDSNPMLTYTELNNGEGHPEGIYAFSADFRVPYFYFYDMKTNGINAGWTGDDTAKVEEVYGYNKHKVKVTFTLTDGTDIKEKCIDTETGSLFGALNTAVIVEAGYILTDIRVETEFSDKVPEEYQVINFKNIRLYYTDYPVVDAEEDDKQNYLDGKTVYMENAVPSEVVVEDPNGHLYVSARTIDASTNNFLTITVKEPITAGTEYFVSYDIMCETGMRTRTFINVPTLADDETTVSTYIDDIEGSDLEVVFFENNVGTKWMHSDYVANAEYNFLGHFIPTANSGELKITFHRGDSAAAHRSAMKIDNFKIWYMKGDTPVYIYDNNFDTLESIDGIKGNSYLNKDYTIEIVIPESYSLYTPIDSTQPMSIKYDILLTDEEAVEGTYHFHTTVKLAEASENATAAVVFNYADGSFESKCVELSDEWSVISASVQLNKTTKLESVSLVFASDVGVQMRDPALNIRYKYEYGRPNWGIVMVLLKKKDGGMVDPWKQVGVN